MKVSPIWAASLNEVDTVYDSHRFCKLYFHSQNQLSYFSTVTITMTLLLHTWRYCLWVWIEYFTEIKSSEWTDEIWIQLFETKLSRYLHIKFMPTCLLERCYVCIYISSRLNNLRITSKKRDFILCFAVYPTLLHKSIVVIE